MKFRKKPVVIEAVRFIDTPERLSELSDFVTDQDIVVDYTKSPVTLKIKTLESGGGFFHADINDWIIKGVKGEFYACKPDIFEASYDPVEKFIKADHDKIIGTHAIHDINIAFSRLVAAFGPPHTKGDDYKVDAEWILEFPDGTIATIYNYKTGKNYLGDAGELVESIRDWHIGGFDEKAYTRVVEVLEATRPKGL